MPKKVQKKLFRPKSKYKVKKQSQCLGHVDVEDNVVIPAAGVYEGYGDGDGGKKEGETTHHEAPSVTSCDVSSFPPAETLITQASPLLLSCQNEKYVNHDHCYFTKQSKQSNDHNYMKVPQIDKSTEAEQNGSECVVVIDTPDSAVTECEVTSSCTDHFNATSSDDLLSTSPWIATDKVLSMFLSAARKLQDGLLPQFWIPIATENSLTIIKVSDHQAPVTQRSITISRSGTLTYFVHGRELQSSHGVYKQSSVDISSVDSIASEAAARVAFFRTFEVCGGVSQLKYKLFWKSAKDTVVDSNPFKEMRYKETCRSDKCDLLVSVLKRMCSKCVVVSKKFTRRKIVNVTADAHGKVKTPNKHKPWKHLITPERRARQERSQKEMRKIKMQNARLREKLTSMIAAEGISLENEDEGNDFHQLVQEAERDCTDSLQKLFLQQQLESLKLKDKKSMRWHPMIIRLALRIKMISTAAYRELVASGVVSLPSERTLFDYSHVIEVEEGVSKPILKDLASKVNSLEHGYQHFHTLMFDEVYISQNLVQKKSTGKIVGYCKLSEVQGEILELERRVKESAEGTAAPSSNTPPIAKRILSFMVRGTASNVKGVVASYPVSSLSKEDLMDYTWDVVEACEAKDIRIVAIVCDGCAVNRAFIDMNPPTTKLNSGVVFDTVNVYAPDRNIYFFSDLPHLGKTVRNCLYNSGKEGLRKMKKNGEFLTWDPIVQLFKEKEKDTVTALHKLSAGCVYLNSYSRMNVSFAMKVLSASVSNMLKKKKWPGTNELSIFGEK